MNRRHFLSAQTFMLGNLALNWLLQRDAMSAGPKPTLEKQSFDLHPKPTHAAHRARAMVSMFMQGGPSHVDLCDEKPELKKFHMQDYSGGDFKFDSVDQASRKLFSGPWTFRSHGECGLRLSELLPHLGTVADDICLIRSMRTAVNNHGQSIFALQHGTIAPGRPSLGAWMTYALGSENDNLPAFMVLRDPASLPVEGVYNWSNGFLPSLFQGTVARPTEPRIANLDAPPYLRGRPQENLLEFLGQLNREHLQARPGENDLSARIASYELAARMQTAAKEAFDISSETQATQSMYGFDRSETKEFGTRCLIARRLIERGVRFVQIFTANQEWDHHSGIVASLPRAAKKVDQPAAALVADLKQRGLLDTTLVHWGGEMGRLPVIQQGKDLGRDHNTYGFSHWLAGGGVKAGVTYGATDDIGHQAVENVVMHYDYHATLFHLFGLNHQRVSFPRGTTTGQLVEADKARIVQEILA